MSKVFLAEHLSRMTDQELIRNFFIKSEKLAGEVLLPLDHIFDNWELRWNEEKGEFFEEEDSFSPQLNGVIRDCIRVGFPDKKIGSLEEMGDFLNQKLGWPPEPGTNLASQNYLRDEAEIFLLTESSLYESASTILEFSIRTGTLRFDDLSEYSRVILGSIFSSLLYLRDP